MKFVESAKVDKKRWDVLVKNAPQNNITCYSWYLDATAKNWGIIVNEDYTAGMPIPYKNRFLFKQIYQPPFSRNLEFFGDIDLLGAAIKELKALSHFTFNFPHTLDFESDKRIFQGLDLKEEIVYKTNAKRILKKQEGKFQFNISENTTALSRFYFENAFEKTQQPKKNKIFFRQLVRSVLQQKKGVVIEAQYLDKKEIVGAGIYLFDKSTIYYLVGDGEKESKKEGVMYGIMDFAIQYFKKDYSFFDFGGSNVKSVADFYRKMGGQDCVYFQYSNK